MSAEPPRPWQLSRRFDEAFLYAHEAHRDQQRKKTSRPYISHLMGVASLVLQYGGDEDQAIAALLHDVVEDCGGAPRLEEIRAKFGERVAHIVDGCTDADEIPKPPWRERKERYIERVRTEPEYVLLVSAADKLYNMREILMDLRETGSSVWERFKGRRDGSLWYYHGLIEAVRGRAPRGLVAELDRTVAELEKAG
ncbi:MAG TPA: HD domain-containing protein [Candidatus Solibacter sp.]|nr:HD domain-containing protein [Candidatus Solibacter sp.]